MIEDQQNPPQAMALSSFAMGAKNASLEKLRQETGCSDLLIPAGRRERPFMAFTLGRVRENWITIPKDPPPWIERVGETRVVLWPSSSLKGASWKNQGGRLRLYLRQPTQR